MPTKTQIDWSQCPQVEIRPTIQSGRMPVAAIVDNHDYGMTIPEIAHQFELPLDLIEAVLA
jgi:uncharacterized protein (DUF433 family)